MLLAINTATETCAIALIQDKTVLAELAWISQADESIKIPANLKTIFQKTKKPFTDIKSILVSQGPGSYTRLRLGIATANALAFSLNIPIYALDTFTLLAFYQRQPKYPLKIILKAGLNHIYERTFFSQILEPNQLLIDEPIKLTALNILAKRLASLKKNRFLLGDLTKEQERVLQIINNKKLFWLKAKDLVSFGTAITKLPWLKEWQLAKLDKTKDKLKLVAPFYVRNPLI